MNLSKEETELLCDLIGPLNSYEMMAILIKTNSENAAEEKARLIGKLFLKLSGPWADLKGEGKE